MRKKCAQMLMHTDCVLRPTLRLHLSPDCLKKVIKRCRLRRMAFESRILRWEGVFFLPSGVPGFGPLPRRGLKLIIHSDAPFRMRERNEEKQQTAFVNHARDATGLRIGERRDQRLPPPSASMSACANSSGEDRKPRCPPGKSTISWPNSLASTLFGW
jgi:hypothetical protein